MLSRILLLHLCLSDLTLFLEVLDLGEKPWESHRMLARNQNDRWAIASWEHTLSPTSTGKTCLSSLMSVKVKALQRVRGLEPAGLLPGNFELTFENCKLLVNGVKLPPSDGELLLEFLGGQSRRDWGTSLDAQIGCWLEKGGEEDEERTRGFDRFIIQRKWSVSEVC